MINSMWSGVSGLRAHQAKLDVIGNDVANVNTLAYKQGNVTFQDAFYQSLSGAGEGSAGKQVGLGVNIGSISRDFTEGQLQETGVDTHMAISGEGYFVMRDADGNNQSFTRAGNFERQYSETDSTMRLMGADGMYLCSITDGGTPSVIQIDEIVEDITISSGGELVYSYTVEQQATDADGNPVVDDDGNAVMEDVTVYSDPIQIAIASFRGPNGLSQIGSNQYVETSASGSAEYGGKNFKIVSEHLENSNVNLAQEFTEMIVTERGFQANSRTVTTSDAMLQELLNLKR